MSALLIEVTINLHHVRPLLSHDFLRRGGLLCIVGQGLPCKHARFLLSLLEHLIIDFPSHFILSIIDVFRDTTTRDKLIFPSAITQILCHLSVSFPSSDHFSVMCATDYATVKHSEAQFRS